jgi:hypothetical protein
MSMKKGMRTVEAVHKPTAWLLDGGIGLFILVLVYALVKNVGRLSSAVSGWHIAEIAVGCILLLVAIVLISWQFQRSITQRRHYRALQQRGVPVQAKIVGHEYIEDKMDGDQYYIFYQYRPAFVVKCLDPTADQHYFNQPVGSRITVRYLPEQVEVTGLALTQ